MRIEPANVNQIRQASDGRMLEVDADAGNVARDLKAIDPHLKVRFAEAASPPFFAVYWESDDARTTYLVLTAQAAQGSTGVWTGLDQRVVRRIMEIGHSSYDFTAEVERQNAQARKDAEQRKAERFGDLGEQAAHAIRKDVGDKGRAFIKGRP